MQRFHDDLARADTPEFPFIFDRVAAEHLCAFVEACPHVEGVWAARGENIELSGWQAFALANINGWRHCDTGLRRFRTVYIEVPRKNGKSTLLAAVGLYFLGPDGEPGAKVFSAATSTDQARIVFDVARAMALQGRVGNQPLDRVLEIHVEEHKIRPFDQQRPERLDPAAVFKPIAAQTKSQDGKNPHLAIIDELHEHQKRDVWDAMSSALGARQHPLLIAITTAGHNTAGVCFEQRRYLTRLLDRVMEDESYFGLIFEADEGDEAGDPATWAKANPNLGISKSEEYLAGEWKKAQASPAAMGEFLRKHLDIWTSIGAAAIDMEAWRAAEDPDMALQEYAGHRALIGVDLAVREDFASVVAALPDGRDMRVFSWHFLPEAIVNRDGNEHFWGWKNEGLITTTPGAELDLNAVEALVLQLAGIEVDAWQRDDLVELDVESVIYDPHLAAQMAATWDAEGLTAIKLMQRARYLDEPFQRLIAAVDDRRLITDGNPVLTWMAGNTLQKKVQGGDMIYPAKMAPEEKIDGISALVNAMWPLGQAEDEEPAGPSVYESRGVLVV
ncbi:MAG: terminase large subunit [Rhodobacter sp.]|nr:terminase large subunit [Rhodobacter sp.]